MIRTAADVNVLAEKVKTSEGVYFVTAFSGLLAPYWDASAGGLLIGLCPFTMLPCFCAKSFVHDLLVLTFLGRSNPEHQPVAYCTRNA
jgi:glycerol kinase